MDENDRGLRASISLGRSMYRPGDHITGTVHVRASRRARSEAPCVLCSAVLRVHGHLRVDPRWVPLPVPVRQLYSQGGDDSAKSRAGNGWLSGWFGAAEAVSEPDEWSLMPPFEELLGDNTACVFTTPPASASTGVGSEGAQQPTTNNNKNSALARAHTPQSPPHRQAPPGASSCRGARRCGGGGASSSRRPCCRRCAGSGRGCFTSPR